MTQLSIDAVNAMTTEAFVDAFGGIAEHSQWVAERAGLARPFATRDGFSAAFHAVLDGATREELLVLVNAHPDLAGRAMKAGTLTADSTSEQNSVGLNTLSEDEFERFTTLNGLYKAKFGFPFIHAVRGGASKFQILESFEQRLQNDIESEFHTAMGHIKRIIRFRIEDRVS
jgi:2-oxo-4-hydroxy-4-carboxy-5-ureidoimidazoline decarboxylase